jgi:hypothetical protein
VIKCGLRRRCQSCGICLLLTGTGRGIRLVEQLVELNAFQQAAVGYDGVDFFGVGDVGEGIGVEKDEIGGVAGGDAAPGF